MAKQDQAAASEPQSLRVFCSRGQEGYRVHVHPAWLPRHLQQCLDAHGEGVAYLDFEELDRYMARQSLRYERRDATTGSVELTAQGPAAVALSVWLSNMFSSNVR